MRLATSARVTFPAHNGRRELVMRKVSFIRIESSRNTLTDSAEIQLPRNIKFFDNEQEFTRLDITKIFRMDDPVIIELGYGTDANLVEEFRGYISAPVSAGVPIVIQCEDEMYPLKKIPVNYSSPSATLKGMLQDIVPGYEIDVEDISLGGVRLSRTNVARVLKALTDDPWNLCCYMRGKQLIVESKERADLGIVKLNMERDLIDDNLNYRNSEEVLVKVKATSVLVNGQKLDFSFGEDGGQVVNLTYYNIVLPAEIEKRARADYSLLKKGGFDGDIRALGKPSVKHGMRVSLDSLLYPDRDGTYYVDTVVKEFKPADYSQNITLGRRA